MSRAMSIRYAAGVASLSTYYVGKRRFASLAAASEVALRQADASGYPCDIRGPAGWITVPPANVYAGPADVACAACCGGNVHSVSKHEEARG